ncbi:MAG: hypothetical protein JWL64_2246 [Frankiales bacterium]|nr:hypothetical protein [Frankiales bacterium]
MSSHPIRTTLGCLTVLAGLMSATVPAATAKPAAHGPTGTATPTTTTTTTTTTTAPTSGTTGWKVQRAVDPARTLVSDADGRLLATLTDGSRSVVLAGPDRILQEPATTAATVSSTQWVRLLPAPFAGLVDQQWLAAALADRSPDLLAVASGYITGAPVVRSDTGGLQSSDASYGPLVNGFRQEGSDWNDYLQVTAIYDGTADAPEAAQAGALDCSGFVRMVFGRRSGIPMVLTPDGVRLPRRATQIAGSGPGTLVMSATTRPTDLQRLLPGDLVLFDASTDDGTAIDHVGIFLGLDNAGHPRFVSSRKTADGPTLGDLGGRSTLDGTGLYATSLRAVRRL